MYKQVWVSDPVVTMSYTRLSGTAFSSLYPLTQNWYNGAAIKQINSLVTVPVELKDTDFMVLAIVIVEQVQWPGWHHGYIYINGNTGKANYLPIGIVENIIYLNSNQWYWSNDATESAGGSYYGTQPPSSDALQLTWIQRSADDVKQLIIDGLRKISQFVLVPDIDEIIVDYQQMNSIGHLTYTQASLPAAKYGNPVLLERVLVDEKNNRLIRPYYSGIPAIRVYELSSGNLIQDIWVNGDPEQIFAENESHAYVYCRNGILTLIDYMQGVVLSAHRAPVPPDTENLNITVTQQKFAYERRYRRLLSMVITPGNVEENGVRETTRVRGYYPVPLPVRITTPIPLKPPRKNRKTPVLVRLTGDILEPISGVSVGGEIAGTGTLSISNGVTNEYGEVVLEAMGDTAATATITATATIADNEAI